MDNIIISHIDSSSPKYAQVWELREEILRKPLGMSLKNEDLRLDHIDFIMIAEHKQKVIGCLMLHHKNTNDIQLRQMAVYEEFQGKGVGRMLVEAAEKFAFEKGYHKMILHARKVAVGFYKSLGYSVSGSEFFEVGIPHFMMEKPLNINSR